jgi:hypothetical protein
MSSVTIAEKQPTAACELSEKLEEINARLLKVRNQKQQFRQLSKSLGNKTETNSKPKKQQIVNLKPIKKSKAAFHHPRLEHVLAEVVYSPYMTKPSDPYPQEVFRIPEKIRELKHQKQKKISDLPIEARPFDVESVKSIFVKEIVNYNASFMIKVKPLFPFSSL